MTDGKPKDVKRSPLRRRSARRPVRGLHPRRRVRGDNLWRRSNSNQDHDQKRCRRRACRSRSYPGSRKNRSSDLPAGGGCLYVLSTRRSGRARTSRRVCLPSQCSPRKSCPCTWLQRPNGSRGSRKDDGWIPAHPARLTVKQVAKANEHWQGIRVLESVTETTGPPSRRHDSRPARLRRKHRPALQGRTRITNPYQRIPPTPTLAKRANRSKRSLRTSRLPGPEHMSAWMAGLLTMFARDAISGPVPIEVIEAAEKGTGKDFGWRNPRGR